MDVSSRRPRVRARRGDPLTGRELEILTLVAQGERTADIARRLGLSENTVKSHCTRVYRKLGVRNRVEAVRCYLEGQVSGGQPAGADEFAREPMRLIQARLDQLPPATAEAQRLQEALAALRAIGRR